MKHDHKEPCEHLTLQYCKKCNVVCCDGCGREWGDYIYYPNQNDHFWPNYYPYNYDKVTSTVGPTITWSSGDITATSPRPNHYLYPTTSTNPTLTLSGSPVAKHSH